MEDTRRKPTDKVFGDIQDAAMKTWANASFPYTQHAIENKVKSVYARENYADNWSGLITQFDNKNQMVFWHCISYQDSVDFLKEMSQYYGYFVPKEKK